MLKWVNEVENEIPSVTNVATPNALTAIQNKIPDHSKYTTTAEFNKLIAGNFTAKLKQANLATKGETADFIKKQISIN